MAVHSAGMVRGYVSEDWHDLLGSPHRYAWTSDVHLFAKAPTSFHEDSPYSYLNDRLGLSNIIPAWFIVTQCILPDNHEMCWGTGRGAYHREQLRELEAR